MDSEDWDIVKLATALKMVCYPDEEIKFGNSQEVHSMDDRFERELKCISLKHLSLLV
jgi:hypothetical protein